MRLNSIIPLQFEIGDVRDARRMSRVMRDVDMVFHATSIETCASMRIFSNGSC